MTAASGYKVMVRWGMGGLRDDGVRRGEVLGSRVKPGRNSIESSASADCIPLIASPTSPHVTWMRRRDWEGSRTGFNCVQLSVTAALLQTPIIPEPEISFSAPLYTRIRFRSMENFPRKHSF